MRKLRQILGDDCGATLVETTIIFPLVLILTFGLVEFGYVLWQYHAVEKATAVGARWVATGAGVAGAPALAGELYTSAVPDCFVNTSAAYGTPCSQVAGATGWSATCSATSTGNCSSAQMAGLLAAMQAYAPTLTAANVTVQFRGSNMGFVGRGRAIPLITVKTNGLTYNWVALGALLGFPPLTMPGFDATLPAEDQKQGTGL